MAGSAEVAGATDRCDSKLEIKKGEMPGPFFGLDMLMAAHFLAQKYCGNDLPDLRPGLESLMQDNGCGPATPIYADVMEMESWFRAATLSEFVLEGKDDPSFSDADARKVLKSTVEQYGGCDRLTDSLRAQFGTKSK